MKKLLVSLVIAAFTTGAYAQSPANPASPEGKMAKSDKKAAAPKSDKKAAKKSDKKAAAPKSDKAAAPKSEKKAAEKK